MASRPTTIPQLDTNKTNRVAPVAGKVTDGYVLNDLFPSSNANYLHGWAGDWHEWLQERSEDGTTPGTDFTLRGLDALTVTGDGGVLTLKGGDGGGTSGDGGDVLLLPGGVTSGTVGRVGIGYAAFAPDGTLHVHTASAGAVTASSGGDDLVVENSTSVGMSLLSPNNQYCSLIMGDPDDNDVCSIYYYHVDDSLTFRVNALDRMTIDASGNTRLGGVGTTDTLLHLYGTAPLITFEDTVGDKYLTGNSDGNFLIYNVTDTRNDLTITGTGNVGINEISPLGKLHIKTTDVGSIAPSANADELILENNGACGMTIYSNSSSSGYFYFGNESADSTAGMTYSHSSEKMFLLTSGSNAIVIDASQNVGIYEPDPVAKLHVKTGDIGTIAPIAGADEFVIEGSGDSGMTIYSGNTNVGAIVWGDFEDDKMATIEYSHSTNNMTFHVNNGDRVIFNSSGNVAIGGPGSIDTRLHLYGSAPDITFEETSGDKFLLGNDGGTFRIRNVTDARTDFEIDGLGYVGIPTASSNAQLTITASARPAITAETNVISQPSAFFYNDGNNANRYGINIQCGLDTPAVNNDVEWVRLLDGNGTYLCSIAYSTVAPNATFVTVSDERLKTNIVDTQVGGLDILNRLPLRAFDWKDGKRPAQDIAFVAQEVGKVYPPMASYNEELDLHCVLSGVLEPLIVKAIQELSAEIEILKQRLN